VMIGIGVVLGALFLYGMFFAGRHEPPEPVASSASRSAPASSSSSSSSSSTPSFSSPPPPPSGGGDTTFVDPRTGPQSGYDLEAEEAAKQSGLPNAATIADHDSLLFAERMFAKWGIRLLMVTEPSRSGGVGCAVPPKDEVTRFASLVENELALYPQRFLASSGVLFVALCRDAVEGDRRRSAIAVTSNGLLVLDTGEYRDEAYFRATFHRGLYRVIDGRENAGGDAEWTGLNAPGSAYAKSDKYVRDPITAVGSGGSGFVTESARESADDDKAETFRALLLDNRAVERLAAADPIVNRKVRLLQKRMLAKSNAMDSAFWSAAH